LDHTQIFTRVFGGCFLGVTMQSLLGDEEV
jgi:hypothetical protein